MMRSTLQENNEAEAVLIAFAQAGTDANLADWTGRYPQYARDLVRLAAERWEGPNTLAAEDAGADARMLAIGHAVLNTRRQEAQAAPLTSLVTAAKARGLDAETVAARLHLPVAYFWKLHRRLFAPDSLPRTLVTEIAQALGSTTDEVAAYLRQQPTLAAGASYRADTSPRVGAREDFAATLAADSELTPAQRARWSETEA